VDLVVYIKLLQKYLDCALYDKFYDFPFLWETRNKLLRTTKGCVDAVRKTLNKQIPECANLCNKLRIGAFSPVFEGDYNFINRVAGYFGNVIRTIRRNNRRNRKNPLISLQHLASTGARFRRKQKRVPNKAAHARKIKQIRKEHRRNRLQNRKLVKTPTPEQIVSQEERVLADLNILNSIPKLNKKLLKLDFKNDMKYVLKKKPAIKNVKKVKTNGRILSQGPSVEASSTTVNVIFTQVHYNDITFNQNPKSPELIKPERNPVDISRL